MYFSNGMPKSLTERNVAGIAALRQSRGMAMNDFARELELSPRQLADVERGRKSLSIDLLLRVCRRFHKPLEYFLARTVVSRPFYEVQRAADIGPLPCADASAWSTAVEPHGVPIARRRLRPARHVPVIRPAAAVQPVRPDAARTPRAGIRVRGRRRSDAHHDRGRQARQRAHDRRRFCRRLHRASGFLGQGVSPYGDE